MARMMPFCMLVFSSFLIYSSSEAAALQWMRLTEYNFSADIHKHGLLLCVATVPWCGESKAIMAQLLKRMEIDSEFWSQLQLRFIYINIEKNLGPTLYGKRTPTFTLYRDTIPYRYRGKLNVNYILAGIRYGITISSMDLPLTRLDSFTSFKNFTDSTDKAIILFDLCKWAPRILEKRKQENVEEHFDKNDSKSSPEKGPPKRDNLETSQQCNQEMQEVATDTQCAATDTYRFLIPDMSKYMSEDLCMEKHEMNTASEEYTHKRLKNEAELYSSMSYELGTAGLSWDEISGLQSNVNTTIRKEIDTRKNENFNTTIKVEDSSMPILRSRLTCSWENFKQFEGFYKNFLKFARSHLLTPEREKCGIITDEKLASNISLSIQSSSLWFLMMQDSGEVFGPKFFFGGEGMEEFISSSPQLVRELDGEMFNGPSLLLNDTPSVIIFIDRTCTSYDIRKRSEESLQAFRAVAEYYMPINWSGSESIISSIRSPNVAEIQEDDYKKDTKAKGQLEVHILDFIQLKQIFSSNLHSSTKNGPYIVEENKGSKEIGTQGKKDAERMHALLRFMLEADKDNIISSSSIIKEEGAVVSHFSKSRLSERTNGVHDVLLARKKSISSESDGGHDQAVQESGQSRIVREELKKGSVEDLLLQKDTKNPYFSSKVERILEKIPTGKCSGIQQNEHESSGSIHILTENGEMSDMKIKYDLEEESECLNSRDLSNLASQFVGPEMDLRQDEKDHNTLGGDKETLSQEKEDEQISDLDTTNSSHYDMSDADYSGNNADDAENIEKSDPKINSSLSFFFIDGDDELKETLTMKRSVPSLIILDPLQHERYIFPVDEFLSKSSIIHFLDRFIKGDLQGTLRSEEPTLHAQKEAQPHFVNRDFYEFDSTPRVTVATFSQLVMGYKTLRNMSIFMNLGQQEGKCLENLDLAWKKDVLVLFTMPWCGFCKRMELVVREVYRSLRKYVGFRKQNIENLQFIRKSVAEFKQTRSIEGRSATVVDEIDLPVLFQMDCMINECHHIFGHIHQDQEYPTVVLFPACKKDFPITFDGVPTVYSIFKFLAEHGNAASEALYSLEGHIWGRRFTQDRSTVPDPLLIESTIEEMHPLYGFATERADLIPPSKKTFSVAGKDDTAHYPIVGSVLRATEKLSKVSPVFDNSIILIFKADMLQGFEGLILNKPLTWKSLEGLPSGLAGLPSELKPLLELSFLSYGGPVVLQRLPFLSLTHIRGLEGFSEVVPGLYFGGPVITANLFHLIKFSKLDARKFSFFLGYTSWGWQQLLDELGAHFWSLDIYRKDLLSLSFEDVPVERIAHAHSQGND